MPNYKDIENLSERTIAKIQKIMKTAALELFKSVIMMTPVDTGRARGNWQCTENKEASGIIKKIRNESETIRVMMDKVIKSSIEKGIFLTNNLPYIQKLEYGGYGDGPKTQGGYSKQAPQGMVRVSLERIEKDLREIIEDIIKKEDGV